MREPEDLVVTCAGLGAYLGFVLLARGFLGPFFWGAENTTAAAIVMIAAVFVLFLLYHFFFDISAFLENSTGKG